MGTSLSVRAAAETPDRGFRAIEAALDSAQALDDALSTWRSDTELARLNTAPAGTDTPVSPRLAALLHIVRCWRAATDGAFDPAVGPLVAAWDLRGAGRQPAGPELAAARAASTFDHFVLDAGARTVRRDAAGATLDPGGFGKGAALAAAAAGLRAAGIRQALLDFGGQVFALGPGPDGAPWRIRIAHPLRRDHPVLTLTVRDRSAATSGQSERFVTVDGRRFGHVLDPRSGRPVPAWGSVTVVHRDPLVADILSTALLVMGPDAGRAWADSAAVAAVFLIADGDTLSVRCSRTAHSYLEEVHTCG